MSEDLHTKRLSNKDNLYHVDADLEDPYECHPPILFKPHLAFKTFLKVNIYCSRAFVIYCAVCWI